MRRPLIGATRKMNVLFAGISSQSSSSLSAMYMTETRNRGLNLSTSSLPESKNALNKNPEHFERLMTRYTEVGALTVRFSNAGCFLLWG